jgi:hypothetical protein
MALRRGSVKALALRQGSARGQDRALGKRDTMADDRLYPELAAAFVRGSLPEAALGLGEDELLALGRANGLKLHRFKRTIELPRVRAVIGALRGIDPASLLDVGTGRGVFLWPLIDAFPWLAVTAVEPDAKRRVYLEAVVRGGIAQLAVIGEDASKLGLPDGSFDVVTVLEVLEHQADPRSLAAEAVRLAGRFVIASVPSKPDDNPEHLHLFTGESIGELLRGAGAVSVRVEHVLNHIIAIARVDRA